MEWFQLGTMSWQGFASAGWLWLDRETAALIAGSMLATSTATGVWVVLDQLGFPVMPQTPLPTIPMTAEKIIRPWYQSAA